ncbi:MAG TPA: GGDEF domain-containing response regulator [Gemmatimonadaceae bacterium]|nr:GGDEF domain-containing response regulator [Gemmatimonadaceae bacterium]
MQRLLDAAAARPMRVLCVDGDASTAAWLDVALIDAESERVQVEHAATIREALGWLSEAAFDVAILTLAGTEGAELEMLHALQEHTPELALVVLSPVPNIQLAIRAIRMGAQDAIVRGQIEHGVALSRALRFAIERQHVRTALHTKTLVDELTGLYNRRGFISLARQQIKTAERLSRDVVHVFLDVDGMKEINDTFGHREGDLALIESADILRATFRESDVLARMGGDEFAVLALETSPLAAEALVDRLRRHVADRNSRGHRPYALSFSVGSTRHAAGTPCLLDELLARADGLMYEQKRRRFSTPGIVAGVPHRAESTAGGDDS